LKETLNLKILTPEKELYNGEIVEFKSENDFGSFGILPNHVAMITVLKPAITIFKEAGGKQLKIFTSTGILEIKDNIINIMCQAAEWPEEIDINRAEEAKNRSELRLAQRSNIEVDDKRAELALMRALMRIKIKKS
jgi:F-type H+-transporting ATPase subunit epsilon